MKVFFSLALALSLTLISVGCKTTPKQPEDDIKSERHSSGYPKWMMMPRDGLPDGMIAGVGRSDIADVDVEAAKSEAELIARNKIAQELETNIRSTVTRDSTAASEGRDKAASFAKINEEKISNIVAKRIVGSRVHEYIFYNKDGKEDPINPKTVFVRVILNVDVKALAEDLGDNTLSEDEKALFADSLRERFVKAPADAGAPTPDQPYTPPAGG